MITDSQSGSDKDSEFWSDEFEDKIGQFLDKLTILFPK